MADLGCQDREWKWHTGFRCNSTAGWAHTSHFEHGQRKMWLSWVHFRLVWALYGARRVTDGLLRVSGYRVGRWKWQRRFRSDTIVGWVHASMDIGKCGYLGCISGWFGALRGAPRVTDGWLKVSGYRLGRWKWQRGFRCNFWGGRPHTTETLICKLSKLG